MSDKVYELDAVQLEEVHPVRHKISFADRIKERLQLGSYRHIRRMEAMDPDQRAPIFLMVGSLTDCTYKTAVAYARGLAEQFVVAHETAWIRVKDDKANQRYIYEIHDGGLGFSILESLLEQLADGKQVHIQLANNAYVTIEDERHQVFSLIVSEKDEVHPTVSVAGSLLEIQSISELEGKSRMKELYPPKRGLAMAGGSLLTLSLTALTAAGIFYVGVQSGVLDDDIFSIKHQQAAIKEVRESPAFQLSRAKKVAAGNNTYIKTLKKEKGRWSWDLGDRNE